MDALEDVCRDGPRTRDVGGARDDARGRRRDRSARRSRPTHRLGTTPFGALSHDADQRAAGDDEHARDDEPPPDRARVARRTVAASATAQSDWVALSGATMLTRPRENASSRHT